MPRACGGRGRRSLGRRSLVRARQHRRRSAGDPGGAHRADQPSRPRRTTDAMIRHAERSEASRRERSFASLRMTDSQKLPRYFYLHDTVTVAHALLGCAMWRKRGRELLAARLVEVEAYLGANDLASHARRGLRSPRNASMYLE